MLEVAVVGVGEPQVARLGVLAHVVDGGEVAAEEGGEDFLRGAGGGVDGDEGGVGGEVALVGVQDAAGEGVVSLGARGEVARCAVCFCEGGVVRGAEGVVVCEVDDGDVDGVVEVACPVAGFTALRRAARLMLIVVMPVDEEL